MSITSGIVFYIVMWALVFYAVNPLWQVSQGEAGDIVPGTPESAPVDPKVRKKALVTTAVTTVLFAVLWYVVTFQVISIEQISWIEPPSVRH